MHGTIAKLDSSLNSLSSEFFSGSGETRLYSGAISKADGDLLLGGYAPDASGSWQGAPSASSFGTVTQSPYGGSIMDVTGVINPSTPWTNDYPSAQDSGFGGKDAFAIKRAKP